MRFGDGEAPREWNAGPDCSRAALSARRFERGTVRRPEALKDTATERRGYSVTWRGLAVM